MIMHFTLAIMFLFTSSHNASAAGTQSKTSSHCHNTRTSKRNEPLQELVNTKKTRTKKADKENELPVAPPVNPVALDQEPDSADELSEQDKRYYTYPEVSSLQTSDLSKAIAEKIMGWLASSIQSTHFEDNGLILNLYCPQAKHEDFKIEIEIKGNDNDKHATWLKELTDLSWIQLLSKDNLATRALIHQKITKIKVSGTRITTLFQPCFAGLRFLKILDLSNNEISSIEPEAFAQCYNLKKLILVNNTHNLSVPKIFGIHSPRTVLIHEHNYFPLFLENMHRIARLHTAILL